MNKTIIESYMMPINWYINLEKLKQPETRILAAILSELFDSKYKGGVCRGFYYFSGYNQEIKFAISYRNLMIGMQHCESTEITYDELVLLRKEVKERNKQEHSLELNPNVKKSESKLLGYKIKDHLAKEIIERVLFRPLAYKEGLYFKCSDIDTYDFKEIVRLKMLTAYFTPVYGTILELPKIRNDRGQLVEGHIDEYNNVTYGDCVMSVLQINALRVFNEASNFKGSSETLTTSISEVVLNHNGLILTAKDIKKIHAKLTEKK